MKQRAASLRQASYLLMF